MPLKVSDGIAAWIKDFKKSDAPQFKGKSEKERRDQAIAAYLSAKRGGKKLGEEFVFKVDVEGLPSMFMKGNSPGEVKTHLRKLVKQPSMVKSVERQTKHDVKKARRKQAVVGEAKSADKKVEKYVDADGKTKYRMVAVTKEAMNRRDRLRARLHAVGKDMGKTASDLKKTTDTYKKLPSTSSVKKSNDDWLAQQKKKLASFHQPIKLSDEVDPARDEGKPGAVKHAKKMTPGQKNEKLTLAKVRKGLYKTAKAMGDVQAVRKKKVGKRIKRRVLGKLAGKALGALTR